MVKDLLRIVILIGLTFPSLTHAADSGLRRLTLTTAALPPFSSTQGQAGFLDRVAHELFERLGLDAEITVLPAERALLNANSGLDDGDIMRAPGFEKDYPNLLQVPEKLINMEFMAYTNKPNVHIRQWSDLQTYTVAYASGWKIYDRMAKAREVTIVRDINALFPLLEKNRVDAVLIDRWQGLWAARSYSKNLRLQEPPLANMEMFIYMHKRHANLVPGIAKTLAAMKADGSYARIVAETLRPYQQK